jgi:hypothetical protein
MMRWKNNIFKSQNETTDMVMILIALTKPEIAFRVRGKTTTTKNDGQGSNKTSRDEMSNNNSSSSSGGEWQVDYGTGGGPPKKSPEEEIKEAEKALKKQAKLQAWLVEKEKRELMKMHAQQEFLDEQRKLQAEKDAKFFKRAQETKKKLFPSSE